MIPTFKTYMNESVWGDLRKKSLGQETREEDNVDLLDLEGFYEYLKSHYDFDTKELDIEMFKDKSDKYGDHIRIPFSQKFPKYNCVFYSADKHLVYIHHTFPEYLPELYKKLQDNFRVTKTTDNDLYLYLWIEDFAEDEGSNTFCLKVLDFMIDNMDEDNQPLIFKKEMNESVWGDIRKKSLGQEARTEDDVNQLTCEGLLEYLKKHYSFRNVGRYTYDKHLSGNKTFVFVPFTVLNTDMQCYGITYLPNYWGADDNNAIKISIDFFKRTYLKHLYRQLRTVFRCDKNDLFSIIYIYPKDKNRMVDIKFFLEVLDYCATELVFEHPAICILKKNEVVSESVWGDIRKKSLGQEVRTEDDLNLLDVDGMAEYVSSHYEKCDKNSRIALPYWGGTLKHVFIIPVATVPYIDQQKNKNQYRIIFLRVDCNMHDKSIHGLRLTIRDEEIPEWRDILSGFRVIKHHTPNDEFIWVFPKEGKLSSIPVGAFVDILDTILEGAKNPILRKKEVNESVWGDIRKKSLGQEERIENDVDLMDIPTFAEYLKDRYVDKEHIGKYRDFVEITQDEKRLYIYLFKPTNKGARYVLWFDSENGRVTFGSGMAIECPKIYKKLKDTYKLENDSGVGYAIEPDKKATNTFFIEILDFLIDSGVEGVMLDKKNDELVSESVWGDLRKKSLGQAKRGEDEINHMGINDFKTYIENNYSFSDYGVAKLKSKSDITVLDYDWLCVPVCYQKTAISKPNDDWNKDLAMCLVMNYVKDRKYISISEEAFIYDDFLEKLKNMFKVEKKKRKLKKDDARFAFPELIEDTQDPSDPYWAKGKEGVYYKISPKDGSKCTNEFFIKVLNYIITSGLKKFNKHVITKKKKAVNESVWGDIRKKSLGQEERLEEDVNLFQGQEFIDYLNSYYKIADPEIRQFLYLVNYTDISFFVMRTEPGATTFVDLANPGTENAKIYISASLVEEPMDMDLKNKMLDNFVIKKANRNEYKVFPKNGEKVNNRFFIEFIDFILDNASDVIYKKIVERRDDT